MVFVIKTVTVTKKTLPPGADTGIHSGGCEILKRENYTKEGKNGDCLLKLKTISLK